MKLRTNILNAVPTRLVLLVMMFTMSWVNYLMRVNISVSIIAMVPDAPINTPQANSEDVSLLYQSTANNADVSVRRKPEDLETFDWTAQQQAYVISAYAWGYAVTALVGGTLAEMWSPRKLVLTTMFVAGVLSLLSPKAAKIHYLVLVVLRTITGLLLGTQYPAVQALVARWAPPDEKGVFLGVSLTIGSAVGTVFMWNVSGLIIEKLGWDYTFYIPGIIAPLWCIMWWFLVYDSPVLHPRISEKEKKYILTAIGDRVHHNKKNSIAEWRPMFFIGASVLLGAALVFILFGTGETQKWNYEENHNKNMKENESDSDVQKV